MCCVDEALREEKFQEKKVLFPFSLLLPVLRAAGRFGTCRRSLFVDGVKFQVLLTLA